MTAPKKDVQNKCINFFFLNCSQLHLRKSQSQTNRPQIKIYFLRQHIFLYLQQTFGIFLLKVRKTIYWSIYNAFYHQSIWLRIINQNLLWSSPWQSSFYPGWDDHTIIHQPSKRFTWVPQCFYIIQLMLHYSATHQVGEHN